MRNGVLARAVGSMACLGRARCQDSETGVRILQILLYMMHAFFKRRCLHGSIELQTAEWIQSHESDNGQWITETDQKHRWRVLIF